MVAPFVSCTVPTLWLEALPLLSAAAQHGHDQGAEAGFRPSPVARVCRTGPGSASLPSSGDDARDPRGGLCRCKRGAGDFRGAATELMADLIMQQGGLCCVEPMPRAIIRRSSPSANH